MTRTPSSSRLIATALLLGAASLTSGCSGEKPTESVCPPAQTLTYANFGMKFFTDYCTGCHAANMSGQEREGAPAEINLDTLEGIRMWSADVDRNAAAGPAATNTSMPPKSPSPSDEERRRLGEWLACGAPPG